MNIHKITTKTICLKKVILRFSGTLVGLALMVISMNMNTTYMCLAYEPKLLKGVEKLHKNYSKGRCDNLRFDRNRSNYNLVSSASRKSQ